jgi:alkanesulfonate monooxygenase SsuD/methylene tetrahydromethanopterin reductase-like flavin-dependent oxidoreductase (luciferase family)
MPAGMRPEQLKKELATLKRMCEEAGRDFNAIEISANVPPLKKDAAKAAIEQYQAAGAHRVITILGGSAFDQDPAALEKAADAFLS